ncbi:MULTISPECIES: divalent-cation tolerance protein CutA [Desulfobacula]|uniref:CutA: divalent-cation tolerance protein n=2 Tax=Desulfobacula TaxID=28222 RepID=K0NBN0_DESTT|nr:MULTISPECIES: divalent-cation tolerance protein CutA [Desulfobacula]CCK81754.1 CutA: divalent-cation tolerance protein [Desulfobacula toluolica Tol2]SDT85978.1 divalent cation tolerance protein [Desulfobacula phenolica]
MEYCIVLTTCPNNNEAKTLASKLIKEKLAACVQLSSITSYYTWKGDMHNETEIRLIIKTRSRLYETIEQFIQKNHSYDVPQIVQIPINDGSDEYLDWIDENTTD